MHAWVPFALVRITFFYVIGTLICIYNLVIFRHSSIFFITLGVAICYALLWVLIRRNSLRRFNIVLSLTGFLTILCLGYLNVKWSNQSEKENHIINSKKIEIYAGRVVEPMHETNKTFRYLISVNALKDSIWKSASGLVYFYVNKDSEKVLKPGDQLLINGAPSELTPPLNPGEFDYKRFLSFKNIYHQDYSNGDSFVVVGHKNINWFLHTANTIRDWAKRKIKYAIPHAREQKIALALILGVRDGLTDDIKSAYSASGAMHVLAVSGLHVGIIYGIVLILFGKLQHGAAGRRGFALLTISLLWFYAAITGFSPSVLRAATMFSFIALAKGFGRNTNIYNTLAGSGLILLVFDPYLIMSVGFQLSYLAVVGIIYFQPKIYNLFISKNWILDKIWMITTVSVAAQLATFSLGLLYFHQFPSFF